MDPVKVKVYGFFTVTKSKYIAQLVMCVLMAGTMLYVWRAIPRLDPKAAPQFGQIIWWVDRVPYLLLVVLGLVAIEAFFVFRAFARKEAERAADLAKEKDKPAQPEPLTPPPADPTHPVAPEPQTESATPTTP